MQAWSDVGDAFQINSIFLSFVHMFTDGTEPASHFKNFNFKNSVVIQTCKTISLYF